MRADGNRSSGAIGNGHSIAQADKAHKAKEGEEGISTCQGDNERNEHANPIDDTAPQHHSVDPDPTRKPTREKVANKVTNSRCREVDANFRTAEAINLGAQKGRTAEIGKE